MTDKRDLKRRVRERQERTGESYMTALRHVRAQEEHEPQFPVVELIELTDIARTFAMTCRVSMFPSLAGDVDPRELLATLCLLLGKTEADPAFDALRAMVLHGEKHRHRLPARIDEAIRFASRVQAGVGGISEGGNQLAIHVDAKRGPRLVLFMLNVMPAFVQREPTLLIAAPTDVIAVLPGMPPNIYPP